MWQSGAGDRTANSVVRGSEPQLLPSSSFSTREASDLLKLFSYCDIIKAHIVVSQQHSKHTSINLKYFGGYGKSGKCFFSPSSQTPFSFLFNIRESQVKKITLTFLKTSNLFSFTWE